MRDLSPDRKLGIDEDAAFRRSLIPRLAMESALVSDNEKPANLGEIERGEAPA